VTGAYFSDRRQTLEQYETLEGFGSWSQLPGSGLPAGCTVQSPACPYPTFGDVIQYVNGGINPSQLPNPDLNFTFDRHVSFMDTAVFNETSYHLTDKWQATAGGASSGSTMRRNWSRICPPRRAAVGGQRQGISQ